MNWTEIYQHTMTSVQETIWNLNLKMVVSEKNTKRRDGSLTGFFACRLKKYFSSRKMPRDKWSEKRSERERERAERAIGRWLKIDIVTCISGVCCKKERCFVSKWFVKCMYELICRHTMSVSECVCVSVYEPKKMQTISPAFRWLSNVCCR